jgi:hypothetical protein
MMFILEVMSLLLFSKAAIRVSRLSIRNLRNSVNFFSSSTSFTRAEESTEVRNEAMSLFISDTSEELREEPPMPERPMLGVNMPVAPKSDELVGTNIELMELILSIDFNK